MIYKQLYAEIGKLLYAIADADMIITKTERIKLLEQVKERLAPAEKLVDEFGTDLAYYTEIEFDFEDETIAESETAFNSFLDFVEDHHTGFTEKMKDTCIFLAEELADVYHGTNKKEKALLIKLRKKLNELEFKK